MIKNKTRFTSASFPPVTVNLSIKREQVYPFRDLNTDFSVKSVQKLKKQIPVVYFQQEHAYSSIQVSPAWRVDQEMKRRLILQET